jgi:hypothetical protein
MGAGLIDRRAVGELAPSLTTRLLGSTTTLWRAAAERIAKLREAWRWQR